MKRIKWIICLLFAFNTAYNQDKLELKQYEYLKLQLDTIFNDDQGNRILLDEYEAKYGEDSKEVNDLWIRMEHQDSLDLLKIEKIIQTYGWLGADKIGNNGSDALFLVIQHSNKKTMEYYLPILKDAAKKGNASVKSFAMLQDRVEMLNHRPQIYGTQIQFIAGKYVLYKVLDEVNINKRRNEIGLNTIEEYLKDWNINYKPIKQ